jgi:RIO-like serine/threonine protein kinase
MTARAGQVPAAALHPSPANGQTLKKDLFGTVRLIEGAPRPTVVRDTRSAARLLAWLARGLARREARALQRLGYLPGTPRLLGFDGRVLQREWLPGEPMQRARPGDARYYRDALALLRRIHRAGVTHNDLAKETNWLVTETGGPALVDFQLAVVHRRRGRLFRGLAREDLRHLLKHKRTYRPQALTARQKHILATPSPVSRAWRATGKRAYLFVTRRLLGWADREGAGDRQLP